VLDRSRIQHTYITAHARALILWIKTLHDVPGHSDGNSAHEVFRPTSEDITWLI